MLDVLIGTSLVLSIIAVLGFVVFTICWATERNNFGPADEDAQKYAKCAIACVAASLLSWTWPLTVPLAVLYLVYRLAREAFPSGLSKN